MAQLKKSIADVKAKLGQQKNLYEAVRTDKNLYSKNLAEAVEEISEIKEKFRAMISEHFDHQNITRESEKTKHSLEKHHEQQKKTQQVVELQQAEIKKLESTIQEAEVERQTQRKEFEA